MGGVFSLGAPQHDIKGKLGFVAYLYNRGERLLSGWEDGLPPAGQHGELRVMHLTGDNWAEGKAYDSYMGRWSQAAARMFLDWLNPDPRLSWLDVGCGTGALSRAIIEFADPKMVVGCDPSEAFIAYARAQMGDSRLSFQAAKLEDLPQVPGGFEVIVSGLDLNFIADPVEAVRLMKERCIPGGLVAAYVWDYAGRMDFLRTFWDTAVSLDASAEIFDEGERFPLCQPIRLESTFQEAGLTRVRTDPIDIPTLFASFSDYWEPFLAGTGPAPNYVASLSSSQRNRLAAALKKRLEPAGGGKIEMTARAWTVRGELGRRQDLGVQRL